MSNITSTVAHRRRAPAQVRLGGLRSGVDRLAHAGSSLRRRVQLVLQRGQLGPTRELDLLDFLPGPRVGGR
ncbi:MAG TPA: hypothetical protein VM305_03355 [Candidatus Limnocylindrales bacterium]|nr:hypothetical protein [Candidatus Limnocylindrales bacterium]